ncbi:hypothetical protein ACFLRF_01335 [Candidatus Altiarchaeota archaeon]
MKKTIFFGTILVLMALTTLSVAKNGAVKGVAADPNYPQLGDITYLANKPGYHFWFTMEADLGRYEAGHSYHNVYKFDVKDTSEWCGPVTIPNRAPYNLVGPVGASVYYKIWDVTEDVMVCPA